MDYSKRKQAQLIEEIEALQEKIAELERAEAERLSAEQAGKRAEEALRIKDQAIASSISGIVLLDLDGTITYVNQTYLDMFAYNNVEEAIGHNIAEVAADKQIAQMLLTAMQTRGGGGANSRLRLGTAQPLTSYYRQTSSEMRRVFPSP